MAAVTAIALGAALLGAVACEQVLSIDGPVTVVPHEACGLPVSAGTCQACVASSCCSQATACAGAPACLAYESCLLECASDYMCRTTCAVDHNVGLGPEVPALDQCVVTHCNDACSMTCGLTASPTDPDAAAACETCIAGRACLAAQTCGASLECETIEHCVPGCSTVDCHDNCLAMDDSGTFTAVEVALVSACLKDCHLGNFWLCLGGVTWPLAPAGVSDVAFTLRDSVAGPLPGAGVKACGKADEMCALPMAKATADDAGQGTLHLPAHGAVSLGFQGYYDVDALDASMEMHEIFFASSPLTRNHAQFTWALSSQTAFLNLVSSAHVTLESTRGHIAVGAVDCLLSPASGVTFTATPSDANTKFLYLAGGILLDTTEGTDLTGIAFLLNAPPGTVTIQAFPKALGGRVASSTEVVFTRPGTVSVVTALPTP